MELILNEVTSKVSKRLEAEVDGYKVSVNVTINNGKIENLNGNIIPADSKEGVYVEGTHFNAYKRNDEWRTDVSEVANAEYAAISAIAVAAVNYAVKTYEAA